MKYTEEEIAETALKVGIPLDTAEKLTQALAKQKDFEKEATEKKERPKWITVIYQNDIQVSDSTEIPSIVLQIPEDQNHNLVPNLIRKSINDYYDDRSSKRKKKTFENLFEAILYLPKKYLKANGIKVISGELTIIVKDDITNDVKPNN